MIGGAEDGGVGGARRTAAREPARRRPATMAGRSAPPTVSRMRKVFIVHASVAEARSRRGRASAARPTDEGPTLVGAGAQPRRGRLVQPLMATIAHLSDIHFGAHDEKIVAATEAGCSSTGGPRHHQRRFHAARPRRAIPDGLGMAQPAARRRLNCSPCGQSRRAALDVARRFARPLARYKRYISNDLCPWYEDDRLAVLGINTARSLTIKDGASIASRWRLSASASKTWRRTRRGSRHAPPALCDADRRGRRAQRSGRAARGCVKAVCQAGVHIALAGHFHRTYADAARKMVQMPAALWSCRPGRPPPSA